MSKKILVDTGPLYASTLASDALHQRAVVEWHQLQREGYILIVPYPIMLECYNLLARRTHQKLLLQWQSNLRKVCALINPIDLDYQSAFQLIEKYPDKYLSLFDVLLVTLHYRLGYKIWTFDKDFYFMNAEVWFANDQ